MHINLYFIVVLIPLSSCSEDKFWNLSYSSSLSAYTEHSNTNDLDLNIVLPNCRHCVTLINLFNNIDLLPSPTPLIVR